MSDAALAWFRAQLDDEERVAHEVADQNSRDWAQDGEGNLYLRQPESGGSGCWDSTRVLAEIEVKRKILDEIVPKIDEMDATIEAEWGNGLGPTGESDQLVKLLAQPYADRPGFPQEWR